MEHNLLEIFDNKVKPILFDELKREHPSIDKVIYQHLTIIHASILGGLIEKSKKPKGSRTIKNLIEKGNHNGDIINRISEIFGDEKQIANIKKLGNSLLAFVFEDGTDKAFEKIQHFLSEKYLTTQEDLIEVNRMIAPFSMGLIGKIVHEHEMTEQQVTELLAENEPFISMRFPGLAKVLGIKASTFRNPDQDSRTKSVSPSDSDLPDTSGDEDENSAKGENDAGNSDNERELFLKSLWPWVALLLVSGLSLFLLKQYQSKPAGTEAKTNNPFNFIQSDSLILDNQKAYTLPGNVLLEVDRNSTLDSLLIELENKEGIIDTLRYLNPEIIFQDSSAVLTPSANKELSHILSILQSYPELKMHINIYYDKTYLVNHSEITIQQIKNLREYFTVFGLDNTRFKINKLTLQSLNSADLPDMTDTIPDTVSVPVPPKPKKEKRVELLFYHDRPVTTDSLNIQK